MKNFTTRLQRDITTNHPIFLTNRSKLWVFVKICKKSLGTDRLQNTTACCYDDLTTTYEGNRNPYSSGIFLSQIFLSQGIKIFFTPSKAEFVKWLISGNKASNRTNNASHSYVAVETISHPFKQGGNLLLTKPYEKITMLFKFLFTGEKRLTVRVRAKSEAEARQRIQLTSPAICIARFSDNLTACKHSPMGEVGEMAWTPMVDGHAYSTSTNGVSNTEQKTILHPFALIGYSAPVVAKSTASREKLNDLPLANSSTPLTRAFFVRSLRTPKENAFLKNKERSFLSMVGRIGQRLGVGCLPMVAVSHPDTLYRPAVRSKAVDIQKLPLELSQMFYKFLFTGSRLRITVYARTLAEAYKRLPLSQSKPVLIARLPVQGGVYA